MHRDTFLTSMDIAQMLRFQPIVHSLFTDFGFKISHKKTS